VEPLSAKFGKSFPVFIKYGDNPLHPLYFELYHLSVGIHLFCNSEILCARIHNQQQPAGKQVNMQSTDFFPFEFMAVYAYGGYP